MQKDKKYPPHPSTLPKLDALMAYIAEYRRRPPLFRPPSIHEMAEASGCNQTSIRHRLGILERQGKITWTPGVSRSVIPAFDTDRHAMILQELGYK